MKFDRNAPGFLIVKVCFIVWNAAAFAPRPPASSVVPSTTRGSLIPFCLERPRTTRLFLVDDDDEAEDDDDDDDDDEDPLGDGVDSVSWLPSVIGAKGKEISSAREVSRKTGFKEKDENYCLSHSLAGC